MKIVATLENTKRYVAVIEIFFTDYNIYISTLF